MCLSRGAYTHTHRAARSARTAQVAKHVTAHSVCPDGPQEEGRRTACASRSVRPTGAALLSFDFWLPSRVSDIRSSWGGVRGGSRAARMGVCVASPGSCEPLERDGDMWTRVGVPDPSVSLAVVAFFEALARAVIGQMMRCCRSAQAAYFGAGIGQRCDPQPPSGSRGDVCGWSGLAAAWLVPF